MVGVVGAGTMGAGVAQCAAQAGYRVVVVDPAPEAVARARARVVESLKLSRLLARGTATATPDEVLARVSWAQRLDQLDGAGFVVECVTERQDLKEAVFAELDRCTPAEAVLASCTSAIPIAGLAARTTRPDRVLGLHFMNPAPLKKTVEVVRAPATSERAMNAALTLLRNLGKDAVVVPDGPGFVLNRVLMLTIAEAAAAVTADTTGAETVDAVFERCLGHPMGPLRTADLIGLDNVLDTLNVLRANTGDDRYRVPPVLADLVRNGHFGRKTGRGFHVYS
ncbi:3-hydroxybutyryl-CoA dehydrogenase [Goodfellowiella coeruleoviolacea]|uniref:3-hydroxybutyryl-CoA dehydrogenase n=1 Tax=Goodfellowiella coeruleoviolacea TaxID=334858 RepID=A0AAE3KMI9_9PSEU|nr:3-hydroxybutyryl-CoA dehydrogenase [Goodfellowiella coeruleoviolacea]